jgi:hypothetical protein
LTQALLTCDEQLSLVRKVAKERALRDAGPLGDLSDGGGVLALLGE